MSFINDVHVLGVSEYITVDSARRSVAPPW